MMRSISTNITDRQTDRQTDCLTDDMQSQKIKYGLGLLKSVITDTAERQHNITNIFLEIKVAFDARSTRVTSAIVWQGEIRESVGHCRCVI